MSKPGTLVYKLDYAAIALFQAQGMDQPWYEPETAHKEIQCGRDALAAAKDAITKLTAALGDVVETAPWIEHASRRAALERAAALLIEVAA